MWYGEIKDYKVGEEILMKCGHLSQMLWRDTTTAGFGRAQDAKGITYVVGHYAPFGNWAGKWAANVPASADGRTDLLDVAALKQCTSDLIYFHF